MAKVKEPKLSDLIPDDKNMNKHNQYGMSLLEKSVSKLGLGRSILVDKNNRIIAGNGVTETAANLGMEDIIVVPTDGTKLVVVQRTDVDIDSEVGRSLALADNAVAHVNLEWDEEALKEVTEEWGIDAKEWGVDLNEVNLEDEEEQQEAIGASKQQLIVTCSEIMKLSGLFSELKERGFDCKLKE